MRLSWLKDVWLLAGGSARAAGAVPCGDLAEQISWLILKIDTQLNHLKELMTPLTNHTLKTNPKKLYLASSL